MPAAPSLPATFSVVSAIASGAAVLAAVVLLSGIRKLQDVASGLQKQVDALDATVPAALADAPPPPVAASMAAVAPPPAARAWSPSLRPFFPPPTPTEMAMRPEDDPLDVDLWEKPADWPSVPSGTPIVPPSAAALAPPSPPSPGSGSRVTSRRPSLLPRTLFPEGVDVPGPIIPQKPMFESPEEEVHAQFSVWASAVANIRPYEVARLYTDDAVLMPADVNMVCASRGAITTYYQMLLAKQPVVQLVDGAVTLMQGGMATHTGLCTMSVLSEDGRRSLQVPLRFMLTYRKVDDRWMIQQHHMNSDTDTKAVQELDPAVTSGNTGGTTTTTASSSESSTSSGGGSSTGGQAGPPSERPPSSSGGGSAGGSSGSPPAPGSGPSPPTDEWTW